MKLPTEAVNKPIWMVRAGRGAEYIDDFLESEFVGIGFPSAGELTSPVDKGLVIKRMLNDQPDNKFQMAASQVKHFYDEFNQGDLVLTYDPGQRLYFLGLIRSDVENTPHVLFRSRRVSWFGQVSRNALLQSTRNSLGAISTLFTVKGETASDVIANLSDLGSDVAAAAAEVQESEESESENLFENIETRANELLEDKISKLDWEQCQQLVAEILEAMGFKAEISPRGSDRGIDVFASKDGQGLVEPRIFVEVKHRTGTRMGADDIRTFLGVEKWAIAVCT